ncbi:MAG: LytTR family DNA-binding domain-containing protein [Ferruginibacter sp.]
MNIIIIEDERPAAEKLQKAIKACSPHANILAVAGTVQAAVEWLQQNALPDLVFMDIQLTDGLSFKIFEQVKIGCPVIFTTAYDNYWQEAFEYNSIDYLLKPIRQEKLENALQKFETVKQYFSTNLQRLVQYHQEGSTEKYRKRFLVKRGSDYFTVKTEDIAYFYAIHKVICLADNEGHKFILDRSLADIEKETDPAIFYRVNRKYLINISSIKKIKAYAKGKLQLELQPPTEEEIIVSQENTSAFKEWMGN